MRRSATRTACTEPRWSATAPPSLPPPCAVWRRADARTAIRTLLTERIRIAVGHGGQGCLAVNAVCERLPQDAATRRTVRDMQDASREALTEVLQAAMERGEIAARHTPHAVAAFLVTFLNGLLVSSKITPDASALEPLVDVALTALD